jgi:hypothetical protein
MTVKTTEQEDHPRPKRTSNFDWASMTAFAGATALGLASVVNHVHSEFKKKYIMNRHDGERTPYADTYDEYFSSKMKRALNGEHLTPEQKLMYEGKIPENARSFSEKMKAAVDGGKSAEVRADITQQYMTGRKALTKAFDEACDKIGWKQLQIPYENKLKKWTVGTWKKAQVLGDVVQKEALIRFGTVAVVGLGAALAIKHSRNVLDQIEQKLETRDENHSR